MSKYLDDKSYFYKEEDFLKLPTTDRTNRTFVLKCLKRNGLLYSLIEPELQSDEEVILTALTQDQSVYRCIPQKFRNDAAFTRRLVELNHLIYDELPDEVRSKRELVLYAISFYGVDALWHMPAWIFADSEIMVRAFQGHNGSDDSLWDAIVCSAGSDAEHNFSVLHHAYIKEGDSILGRSFEELERHYGA
jgi:hypothetical protein